MSKPSSNHRTVNASQEPQAISLRQRFLNLRTLVSFALALAILFFLATRLDLDIGAVVERMSQSNPLLFLGAFVSFYLSFPLRAERWRILLHNAGIDKAAGVTLPSSWRLCLIVFLSWFANCILPAKLGDAYRAYLLRLDSGVSFSKTAGTILAERIVDMVVLFALLAGAAVGVMGAEDNGTALVVVEVGLGMVAILGLGLFVMQRWGRRLMRWLPARFQPIYHRFEEGTLASFRRLPLVVVMTIGIWLSEVGRLLLVTYSARLRLGLPLVIFVALANSLLTAIPFTPGGLGLVEAGVVGLLMMATSRDSAVSVAILDRVISYWSLIVFGLLALPFAPKG